MKRAFSVALCTIMISLTVACSNFERTSFQTLAASKAVIDTAQVDYESRKLPHTACVYKLVNDAKAGQTVAVDALLEYDKVATAKGDTTALQSAVVSDLAALGGEVAAIKSLYSNPKCGA